MKPAVLEFELLAQDLFRLLQRGDAEEKLLSIDLGGVQPMEVKESLENFRRSAEPFAVKMSHYAMQLVLLYGGFERLIEGLIAGFVALLNDVVPSTSDLPARIAENHRRKSLDALRDEVWMARQKDPALSIRLIENLHSCESGAGNYCLNALAYTRHPGNFRRKSIDDAFRDVGVDDFIRHVANTREFGEYAKASGHSVGALGSDMTVVDDLAERRNDIAHGTASNLLTRQELREYVTFFQAFSRSSFSVLQRHLGRLLVHHHSSRFQGAASVHYRSVLWLNLKDFPEGTLLQIGDPVAIETTVASGFELGRIETIRTDAGDVRSIRAHGDQDICLGTSCKIALLGRIFFIKRDCPSVSLVDGL